MQFTYKGDDDIYVLGLKDTRTGNPVTSATVTAVISTNATPPVPVGSPITLSLLNAGVATTIYDYPEIGQNTAAPAGSYRGPLLANQGLTLGTRYLLEVTGLPTGGGTYTNGQIGTCKYDATTI